MRLERAYHHVLHSKSAGVLGGRHPCQLFVAVNHELQAVLLNGFQMRPARHHAYVLTRQGQFHRQISADRSGAVNTNLHRSGRCQSAERASLAMRSASWVSSCNRLLIATIRSACWPGDNSVERYSAPASREPARHGCLDQTNRAALAFSELTLWVSQRSQREDPPSAR